MLNGGPMDDEKRVVDAEFEVVEPLWKAIRGQVAIMASSVAFFSYGFWQGVKAETSTFWVPFCGACLAAFARAGWSIARTLRRRRSSQPSKRIGGQLKEIADRTNDSRISG